ncbi:protein translocase subunit SecF [Methanogenium marinum]|uniref:Protein-export membrane protein SecF n=1 Tax=Methanogenium marinum TaxID=348610 RepID=A0A9Q4KN67_9EURY|nr:protein translocase subunit SecF [Methanogenium marinum]MDE4907503.1 protein translocase subunit SecF [Methanogenium marinum]
MKFPTYDISKYTVRQLVALPIALLIVSFLFLGFNTLTTGMPVDPGIDFAGGVAVTIPPTADSQAVVEGYFSGYPLKSVGEGVNGGYYVVFEYMPDDEFLKLSEVINEHYPDAKVDQIGETFGKTLQAQALWALLFSFIGMAIVVFIVFRNFVPSIAVVLSAFSDIVITAALMDVVGITLTLGTTAALLMLIGYSVDSDILLTTRVLKRKGKFSEKMQGAFRTGFTMTSTTISAVALMFIVSWIGQIDVIRDISAVLLLGLFVDLMNTWMLNAGILTGYAGGDKR